MRKNRTRGHGGVTTHHIKPCCAISAAQAVNLRSKLQEALAGLVDGKRVATTGGAPETVCPGLPRTSSRAGPVRPTQHHAPLATDKGCATHACMPKTLTPIVGNGGKLRAAAMQAGKVVDQRMANAGVQTARALTAGIHIPHTQATRQQPRSARGTHQAHQRAAGMLRPQGLKNLPELVLRMGVILTGPQRRSAPESCPVSTPRCGLRRRAATPSNARASQAPGAQATKRLRARWRLWLALAWLGRIPRFWPETG